MVLLWAFAIKHSLNFSHFFKGPTLLLIVTIMASLLSKYLFQECVHVEEDIFSVKVLTQTSCWPKKTFLNIAMCFHTTRLC